LSPETLGELTLFLSQLPSLHIDQWFEFDSQAVIELETSPEILFRTESASQKQAGPAAGVDGAFTIASPSLPGTPHP
jgi:hypothetical protein